VSGSEAVAIGEPQQERPIQGEVMLASTPTPTPTPTIPPGAIMAPDIERGLLRTVRIFDVTEDELDEMERGTPSSLYLDFAIFCISVGLSFLVSLCTTGSIPERVFTVFVVIVAVGLLIGLILLALWWRTYKSTQEVIKRIRKRLPGGRA